MLIRKNTKAFKVIKEIVLACKERADRQQLVRVYITRAGHTVKDRIQVESLKGDSDLFYNMNYETIVNSLESSDRQLYESEEVPGIYFFHTSSNKTWDETPFEFDESIGSAFPDLSDVPFGRKKEKVKDYVYPTETKSQARTKAGSQVNNVKKVVEETPKEAKQPSYGLKNKIEFTDLSKVVFRKPQVTKKDLLDYYSKHADQILPYLKDRPVMVRGISKGRNVEFGTLSSLPHNGELPIWIKTQRFHDDDEDLVLTCPDKEHLLLYVELGGVEFRAGLSKIKSPDHPDHVIIVIESPDIELEKAIAVALASKDILSGLRLPSFVKSDGQSALHIYIPLDGKSGFEYCLNAAELICKLIRLKCIESVALEDSDDNTYGKVSVRYKINDDRTMVVAPYSFVLGDFPSVAAPLSWSEIEGGLQLHDLNIETVTKRFKHDPFEALYKKKVNGDELLERMEENYGFLF